MLAKSAATFSLLIGMVFVSAVPLKGRQKGQPSTGGGTGLGDIIAQFPNPPVHVPNPVTTTTTMGRRDVSPTPTKVVTDLPIAKATPHLELGGSKNT